MSVATETIHAHRCETCAAKGEQVIWIHTEACRGVVQAHTCPKCGGVSWKQFLVEPGKLPQVAQKSEINLHTILGYVATVIVAAILGYAIYWAVSQYKAKKISTNVQ